MHVLGDILLQWFIYLLCQYLRWALWNKFFAYYCQFSSVLDRLLVGVVVVANWVVTIRWCLMVGLLFISVLRSFLSTSYSVWVGWPSLVASIILDFCRLLHFLRLASAPPLPWLLVSTWHFLPLGALIFLPGLCLLGLRFLGYPCSLVEVSCWLSRSSLLALLVTSPAYIL